jgi:hypothetical protein
MFSISILSSTAFADFSKVYEMITNNQSTNEIKKELELYLDKNTKKDKNFYIALELYEIESYSKETIKNISKELYYEVFYRNVWFDNNTGFIWQNDGVNSTFNSRSWKKAKEYCQDLSLDGFDDWRLPTIDELETILTKEKSNKYTKKALVDTTLSSYYWSSTTGAYNSGYAWQVDFSDGSTYGSDKTSNYYVRCVRAGQ